MPLSLSFRAFFFLNEHTFEQRCSEYTFHLFGVYGVFGGVLERMSMSELTFYASKILFSLITAPVCVQIGRAKASSRADTKKSKILAFCRVCRPTDRTSRDKVPVQGFFNGK